MKEINWDLVPVGTKFTAQIENVKCSGVIQKEFRNEILYNIFLCQDVKDGMNATDKLGYKYSWHINMGTNIDLINENVEYLILATSKINKITKLKYFI